MTTQQQCVARRMGAPTWCGALLLRAGQLQRGVSAFIHRRRLLLADNCYARAGRLVSP